MIITTTSCGKHGHREFVLTADEARVPESYLQNIALSLEELVAQGKSFAPDQYFQLGWMTTKVQDTGDGRLSLSEPDMETVPLRWVPGITSSLRQMMLQLFVADSVSLREEIAIPTEKQTLVVCNRFTESDFVMTRSDPTAKDDTGWFLGCLDPSHDHNATRNLKCLPGYEVLLKQRAIQGFITLPVGVTITMKGGIIEIARNGVPLTLVPDSYLDRLARGEIQ